MCFMTIYTSAHSVLDVLSVSALVHFAFIRPWIVAISVSMATVNNVLMILLVHMNSLSHISLLAHCLVLCRLVLPFSQPSFNITQQPSLYSQYRLIHQSVIGQEI